MGWYWLLGIVGASVLFFLILLLRGLSLRTVSLEVPLPNLPADFDGYRIALISDLHDRRFGKDNRHLADGICAQSPDLVICAGDMHEFPQSPQPFLNLLSVLSRKFPVIYTEGNHEVRHVTPQAYEEYLKQASATGARVLNDDALFVKRGDASLGIYGQSWNGIREGRPVPMDPSMPSLLICHSPMQFDRLPSLPDLMVSGHVHGGILRLPFIGPVFAPGEGAPVYKRFAPRFFFPKYSRGLYEKGIHKLVVTQGLGFSVLPIRIIPAEIMILTLKSDKKMNNS